MKTRCNRCPNVNHHNLDRADLCVMALDAPTRIKAAKQRLATWSENLPSHGLARQQAMVRIGDAKKDLAQWEDVVCRHAAL